MPVTRIRSLWDAGDLVFSNDAGVEIARFDHSTQAFDITNFYLGGNAVTATAAQLNSVSSQIVVRNNAGAMPAGTLVAVTGWDVGEGLPEVTAAGGNLPATHVLVADSAGGDNVLADEEALVTGLDTVAIGAGDPVYLGLAGAFGAAPLVGVDQTNQVVGVCAVSDAVNGEVLFFPGYPRIMARGTSFLQDGSVSNDKLAQPAVVDYGVPSKGIFYLSAVTTHNDQALVGVVPQRFTLRHLTTDTTDDTADGSFNNTTNPLTVAGYAASYPNSPTDVGELILVANEVLEITAYDGVADEVTFRRGVSGTAAAAHANGVNIFGAAAFAAPAADVVYVGVADNTQAQAATGLAADINARGSGNVVALRGGDTEVFLMSASGPGATPVASDVSLTLASVGSGDIEVEQTTGRLAQRMRISMQNYVVQAHEVAVGNVRLAFPFEPQAVMVVVYTAAGVLKMDLTNEVTIAGYRVDIDDTGVVDLAATDVIRAIAWRVG